MEKDKKIIINNKENSDMNIIFLGLMFCDLSLNDAYRNSTCGVQIATHTFQENLINGILDLNNLSVINVPPIGSFPIHYKKPYIRKKHWGVNNVEIGFINLPWIKHAEQARRIYSEVLNKLVKGKKNHILVYSLYEPFLIVVNKLKRKGFDIHVCLIQTDAIAGRNGMSKYMTKRSVKEGNRLVSLAKVCDSFVILTKYIAEPLEIGERPYKVIECICNNDQKKNKPKEEVRNICLYTGSIEKAYGICNLVDAFKEIPSAELWICGVGDAEDYIREACSQYHNIRYLGFVSKERVDELRDQCDFLINPRRPDGTYTLYSFPSKTAEYLMSGKPTVMYKLEGIPDDYDQYINYLGKDDIEDIVDELQKIFTEDYGKLKNKAEHAREYMMREKNRNVQARRIVDFLRSLQNDKI